MAGHSSRFYKAGFVGPKAMLQCGSKRMIEHVIDMFDANRDSYYVVLNKQQHTEDPNLLTWLKTLAADLKPVVIDCHDRGPVYSAMQVMEIPEDAEVILSYCDFYLDWDYQRFCRQIRGTDGAIVSFRGFQPASFGETYYAYMRVEGLRMLELREKDSFTSYRADEYASAGIYYFRDWALFKHYAKRLLFQTASNKKEAYASLLYNDMVAAELNVVIFEARRFICLGTPEDYEQYQFWWKFFNGTDQQQMGDSVNAAHRLALIPMAGAGSRFKNFGYRTVKPLIMVNGSPMVLRAARSLPPVDDWIFIPRSDDLIKHPIADALSVLEGRVKIIGVDFETSGQAATCLLASDSIPDNSEIIIASCDYEQRFSSMAWQAILTDTSIDGAIWTYRCRGLPVKNPNAFAYCVVAKDGLTVSKVVEKEVISDKPQFDPLVVGTFWFRRAGDFKRAALSLIDKDIRVNGEHYVGTSINLLIEQGAKFVIFDIDQWISYGDPFELQIMEFWQDHFRERGPAYRRD